MKPSKKHIRWRCWDYSSAGAYFVTICTHNREYFFGKILDEIDFQRTVGPGHAPHEPVGPGHVPHEPVGPGHVPHEPVVGPGHALDLPYPRLDTYLEPTLVGQIAWKYWIEIPQHYPWVVLDTFILMPNHLHGILIFDKSNQKEWNSNTFGPQRNNLSNVIGSYKAAVKRWANQQGEYFIWQKRYHDRVIRNAEEMERIQQYIWRNPFFGEK